VVCFLADFVRSVDEMVMCETAATGYRQLSGVDRY
jgi:hypothetical protein